VLCNFYTDDKCRELCNFYRQVPDYEIFKARGAWFSRRIWVLPGDNFNVASPLILSNALLSHKEWQQAELTPNIEWTHTVGVNSMAVYS